MKLFAMAWRNLRQRALSSTLTILGVLLGTALVTFLWLVASEAERKYVQSTSGFDVVVGPNGTSSLDLVLNAVYLAKPAQGVIEFRTYRELHQDDAKDRKTWGRYVRYAIPFAYGDSFHGFPVCATTDEFFLKWGNAPESVKEDRPPDLRFAAGGPFAFSHEDYLGEAEVQAARHRAGDTSEQEVPPAWRKVVLGALAARQLGLGVGDSIAPAHGTGSSLHFHEEARSEVVGVLEELGSPLDRGIFVPVGLHYRLSDHAAIGKASVDVTADDVELSAVVVSCRPGIGFMQLRKAFMTRTDAIAAVPRIAVQELFQVVGNIAEALGAIAWIVLVVASLGVFLALYNTMVERERDIAILRSIGARRFQIFTITLAEAAWIGFVGAALGVLAAHACVYLFADGLAVSTGVPIRASAFAMREVWLVLGVTALASIAGLIPAWRASSTDVARLLSAN
ncbi:MAG: ABC transporter permease [Planctomycetes bacterium]|nr:ABC transporter permease [Planctomycetota bacterium]MCB9890399.1 ABC transporter permease [Planctomycetota bacterium]MCB9917640.1 ABC transporter permease [Planctomycetota bacterium]